MSTKKSLRNNLKIPDAELLRLALLLAGIARKLDDNGLQSFVVYCSAFLQDQEFQKVFKTARGFVKDSSTQGMGCDDWLVSQLYVIYDPNDAHAEKFSDLFKG